MRRTLMALLGIIILMTSATSFAGVCGDVNNDGAVNIKDITYLINYLYKGGSAPYCETEIGTVTDFDCNIYYTVKIGTQVWMVENLKVTHYRNGDPISNVTDPATWAGLTTGAYCDYDNDAACKYGRLYNWYAVDDSRNIAPAGWHVATDADWQTLVDYLGGYVVAGGKMKEVGTTHWDSPNLNATNESNFTGLPGGVRDINGTYASMGRFAYFWSSTALNGSDAWSRNLAYNGYSCGHYGGSKHYGFSVRCIKD